MQIVEEVEGNNCYLSPVRAFRRAFTPSPTEEQKLSTETSPRSGGPRSALIRFSTVSHLRERNQLGICISLANELHWLLAVGSALAASHSQRCDSKLSQHCSVLSSPAYLYLIMSLARRLRRWWLVGSHRFLFADAEPGPREILFLARHLSRIWR